MPEKMELKGISTLEKLKEEGARLFGLQAGQVLLFALVPSSDMLLC